MPKTYEKIITLDNFYGGIAETDLDIYSKPGEAGYIQGSDILRSKDFLRPGLDMVTDDDASGFSGAQGLVPRVRGYARIPGTNVIYCVMYQVNTDPNPDEYGSRLMKKSTLTGSWSTAGLTTTSGTRADTTDTTEPPFGLWIFPAGTSGELFYVSRGTSYTTVANKKGLALAKFDIPNDTETIEYDALNTAAWGGAVGIVGGAVNHTDGNLYFWKTNLNGLGGRYIGPYDGTTAPSAVTPFSVPLGYNIVQAISYGHYLLIAANDSAASRTSKLFLIDPYSNINIYTTDDTYDTGTFDIQSIALVEGGIKVITAMGDYFIKDWLGGNTFVNEKRLIVGSTSAFSIRPTAVDIKDNVLYFGTNNSISGFNNGIYAYGRERTEDSKVIHNAYVYHGDDVSNIDYRAIKWISDGDDILLHSAQFDGTTYTISRLGTSRDTSNFAYESIYFRPWRNLKSQCLKATFFHSPLAASNTFTLAMKRDDDANFTTIDTAVGTANTSETILRNNDSTLSANFLTGWRHKARFTVASGATTLKLEAIKFKFRTVEQE